jgi:hypothetical protein
VFFKGKHLELVATGYTASMVRVQRVWLHRFLGHETPEMRGLETLSLMWVGGSDTWLMEELWVEVGSFTCQLRRVRWRGAHWMTMR